MRGLGGDDPTRLGPYRLRAVIGDGGMGRVYLGTSPAGRAVAVKVIGPGLADRPDYRKRFAREARAAMAVSGLYTAGVVDADVTGERPYLATEYVPAPSLADAVKTAGPLPLPSVAALAGGLAEALAAIHRAGLVHRDVKPHNILLAPDGPVVIDFGIALGDDALTSLTAVGTAVGSPGYIAPEVLGGQEPTTAADMFALACVLVYAARGVGPFGRGEPLAVAHRTAANQPDLSGLPDFVKTLVTPLLVREPAARPTPAQLLEHLAIVGDGAVLHDALWLPESVRALLAERRREVQRLLAGDGAPSAPVRTLTAPAPIPAPRPSHRIRDVLLATGGAIVLAGGTATAVLLAQGKGSGTTGTHGRSAGVVALGSQQAPKTATDPAPASPSASAPTTAAATPTPTAAASGVLGYRPGVYRVNKLVATDSFGLSSVYLVDVQVNADGSIQVDLRYTDDTDSAQEFGCTEDTADEGAIAIGDASVTSTATMCSRDPGYTKDVPSGGALPSYDLFPSAPAGSGPWTYTISSVEFSGSVSGISIPTR